MEIKEHPTQQSIFYSAGVAIAEVSLAMVARTDRRMYRKSESLGASVYNKGKNCDSVCVPL